MAMEGRYGGGCGSVSKCMAEFVDQGSAESLRYYLSRKTILEMLRDRGYDVADLEVTRSLAEFRVEFGDKPELKRLRISASLRSNQRRQILVVFMGSDEIRTAAIRGLLCQIPNKESLHGLILILQSKMNHFARKELDKLQCKVETFQITELLLNITKHVIQPTYEILTAELTQQLLNKYKTEDKQLPRMLETDAIARYYGLEKGQVVKITCSGGLVDSLVTYRCVK
ncbi:DNA-directed RNA polymerase V subunit 5C [Manihot esculenta]|uniref:Uncharacterized protein n=2 Tax=Manihot esculenta TaxID=3983 RepID=A0ACB7HY50_MANES|nr:DNA-directed RNA polymerase V subunit 5C [Manihot esculenta]KAG8656708.1 hypothetical protein MANES_04G165700v8 [Manihot esculenta]